MIKVCAVLLLVCALTHSVSAQDCNGQIVSDLPLACTWVNYETSDNAALEAEEKDKEIHDDARILYGDLAGNQRDNECEFHYIRYSCATEFPKCNNGNSLQQVCQDTCLDYTRACAGSKDMLVTRDECDSFPNTDGEDCTAGAGAVSPTVMLIAAAMAALAMLMM